MSAVSDISLAEARGHHNIFNPCLSLVSSDRILTYWKLRKNFPSESEKNDSNLSKLIASIREISILMLNTKDHLPTCCGSIEYIAKY